MREKRKTQKRQHCWFCWIFLHFSCHSTGGDFTLFFVVTNKQVRSPPYRFPFFWPPFTFKRLRRKLCATHSWDLELSKLLCTLLCEGDSDFLFLIVIKVACVTRAFALRNKGSFNLEDTGKWKHQNHTGEIERTKATIMHYRYLHTLFYLEANCTSLLVTWAVTMKLNLIWRCNRPKYTRDN